LKKRGWVEEDPNRFLLLTTQGKNAVGLVEQNYVILSRFFEQILSVDKNTAMVDACKMEHLMSIETGTRLLWFMRYLMSNEDLAVQFRKRMNECRDVCDLGGTDECPICGGQGECAMNKMSAAVKD
jgi:Mn-dependent DtxR family transcriptional regulator